MITFELKNYDLAILQNKSKLYSYLNNDLNKSNLAFFKLEPGFFSFAFLTSESSFIKTCIPISYTGDTFYFSAENTKWQTALQKFLTVDCLSFDLGPALLRIYVKGSSDVITIGINQYDSNSVYAVRFNDYFTKTKDTLVGYNHKLTLSDEIISHISLINTLFMANIQVNSVGITKNNLMYADRNVIAKIKLKEELPDNLFNNVSEDDNHIYIHAYILKLLEILYKYNRDIYFDDTYDKIYWADDNTELVVAVKSKSMCLPTDEAFYQFIPQDKSAYIDADIDILKESLNFFNGFFESSWHGLTFVAEPGKEIDLRYQQPTTDVNKVVPGLIAKNAGSFLIDAENLKKVLTKMKETYPEETSPVRIVYNDANSGESSLGVYLTFLDTYEIILSIFKGQ